MGDDRPKVLLHHHETQLQLGLTPHTWLAPPLGHPLTKPVSAVQP